jgi:hypothetical protein
MQSTARRVRAVALRGAKGLDSHDGGFDFRGAIGKSFVFEASVALFLYFQDSNPWLSRSFA